MAHLPEMSPERHLRREAGNAELSELLPALLLLSVFTHFIRESISVDTTASFADRLQESFAQFFSTCRRCSARWSFCSPDTCWRGCSRREPSAFCAACGSTSCSSAVA